MAIEDVLKNKWGIEKGSPLYDIEMEVASICEKMSDQLVRIDNARLQQERIDLESALLELRIEIKALTFGEVTDPMTGQQLGWYLTDQDVPVSELKRARYGHDYYYLPTFRLKELIDYAPVVLPRVIEYRQKHKQLTLIDRMCKSIGGNDTFKTTYHSTYHNVGTIISQKPNLGAGYFDKYILPAEGKVHFEVYIRDWVPYILANFLAGNKGSDLFAELYQLEDISTALAAVIYDIPYAEVTKEQRKIIKQFIISRTSEETLFKRVTAAALVDLGERVCVSEQSRDLINLLMSLRPGERKDFVTWYGRTFRNSTFELWIRGNMADFEKAFLVLVSKKLDKLTPKLYTGGLLIFESDKAEDYSEITSSLTEIYQSVVPSDWIKPKVWCNIKE